MITQQLLPLTLFMLIPVWIPVASMTIGALVDVAQRALGHTPPLTAAEQLQSRRAADAHAAAPRPAGRAIPEAA